MVPIGSVTGQLVAVVQFAEQWLAAAVAAHSFAHLAFLDVPFCFLLPVPNHRAAAAKSLRAAAAGIGTEGVGYLQV